MATYRKSSTPSLRSGGISECTSPCSAATLVRSPTVHRVALYEVMTRLVLPLCSYLPHSTSPTPISSVTTIIDLENVSLGMLWNWRKHLQEASTLATANYPETLNTIAVVNSPSFFPTVWGWVKVCLPAASRHRDLLQTRLYSRGSMKGHATKSMCSVKTQAQLCATS